MVSISTTWSRCKLFQHVFLVAPLMFPRKNPYGDEESQTAPHTPWIWNPATLSNDAASIPSATNNSSSSSNDRPQPSRVRHSSEPPLPSSNNVPLARHATDPVINGRASDDLGRNGSSSSLSSTSHNTSHPHTIPPFNRPVDRPKDPQFYARWFPDGYTQPTTDQSTRPANGPPEAEPESFTARLELKPTFSPKIVRTPGHYKQSSRSSSNSSAREPSQGSVDSLANRMDRMSTSDSSFSSESTSNLSRHSSISSIYSSSSHTSISGVSALVDEPSSMLSPLLIPNTPKPSSSRPIGRNSTYPEISTQPTLSTIAESPPSQDPPRRVGCRSGGVCWCPDDLRDASGGV